ncbi:dual specificity protein phosphatase 10-like [Glandiceps talaboti]
MEYIVPNKERTVCCSYFHPLFARRAGLLTTNFDRREILCQTALMLIKGLSSKTLSVLQLTEGKTNLNASNITVIFCVRLFLSLRDCVISVHGIVEAVLRARRPRLPFVMPEVKCGNSCVPKLDRRSLNLKLRSSSLPPPTTRTPMPGATTINRTNPSATPPPKFPASASTNYSKLRTGVSSNKMPITKRRGNKFTNAVNCTTCRSNNNEGDIREITPRELAAKLMKPHKCMVVIDCRPFTAYNNSHVSESINISCSDRLSKKRLQQGRATLVDLVTSPDGKAIFQKRFSKEIIVYDENTNDLDLLPPMHPLNLVLTSLRDEGLNVSYVKGGIQTFVEHYQNLCANSLRTDDASESIEASPDKLKLLNLPPSSILPFLYLGADKDASDMDLLERLQIKYVLNVTSHIPLYFEDTASIKYKRLPASDNCQQNLTQYFEEASEFIDEARHNGSNILVHCHAGVSRSATLCIAYIMKHTNMTMTDAYQYVKHKRPIISPNLNFMGQLVEFEDALNQGTSPRILFPRLRGIETTV